ncbi:MAG: TonB-dependent receptor [Myxococcales bacterium]|nr:TonB-dependent receptor [Myxococcales bacterium]
MSAFPKGLFLFVLFCFSVATAAPKTRKTPKTPGKSEDPEILLEEFELDAQNVVISASKIKTTIQETPGIITVITSKQIEERGYRTLNDLLNEVPGFEGNRWEGSGWFKESFARGIPRGLLILMNGINIVEPVRNNLTLDYKIPMEIIERVEVTSGPGGVLWGSNALMGIVNIITKSGKTTKGFEFTGGYGTGPGEVHAFRISASYGNSWLNNKLSLFVSASLHSSLGADRSIPTQLIFGPLPAPANDGPVYQLNGAYKPFSMPRRYWVNTFAKLDFFDFSLEAFIPWELDYNLFGPSNAPLTGDFRDPLHPVANSELITRNKDRVMWVSLKYKKRFFGDKFGISVNTHYTRWQLVLDPFGIFNRNPFTPNGAKSAIDVEDINRMGLNVDFDIRLPANFRILFGGEFFFEEINNADSRSFDPLADQTATSCNAPYGYFPNIDPLRPCSVHELIVLPTHRFIGAVFAVTEWRPARVLALQFGVRGQFSDSYNSTALFSGGAVWNIYRKMFLKVHYSEGFRPPDFQSTHINPDVLNQITFQRNPDLQVERSRAIESEFNAIFFENVGRIRQLYLRVDYSYTLMSDVINRPRGVFQNTGERALHSVEFLLRMTFKGDHEFWLGYYFFRGHDNKLGDIRNVPNHTIMAGFRVHLYKQYVELIASLVIHGGMEDLNKVDYPLYEPGATAPYNVQNVGGVEMNVANPVDKEVTKIKAVYMLNTGIRVKNIWKDHLEFRIFVYNTINQSYSDADLSFDDRAFSRPFPKPRISFFTSATFRY